MDALVCDFAQFYQIYDIDRLCPAYAAVLACGLPESSRSLRKDNVDPDRLLLASIVDELGLITWILGDGKRNNIPLPKSMVNVLLGKDTGNDEAYDSPEDFMADWNRIIQG